MKDRVPLYPGRVRLTPVSGQENTYDMVRADEPTQEGTPLNKASLLKDSTATLLGLPDTAVPDDAFVSLVIGPNKYAFLLTFSFMDGSPVVGKTVTGLTSRDGAPVATDENGHILGVSSTPDVEIGISFTEYMDVENFTATLTAEGKTTIASFTVESSSDLSKTITISGQYRFSPNVKNYDVAAIGGGGGGSNQGGIGAGGGGGGGDIANLFLRSERVLTVQIGAGGEKALDGGNTTITELGLSASGGKAAKGVNGGSSGNGGNGGNGGYYSGSRFSPTAGGSRTAYPFDDSSIPASGGGGGGGCYLYGETFLGAAGGVSFGGKGGDGTASPTNGQDAKGFGGGGGGFGYGDQSRAGTSGKGYQGAVMLHWRLVSA